MWVICLMVYWASYLALVHAKCLSLPEVENASNNITTPGPYSEGTPVRFYCVDGYTQQGNPVYVCSENTWQNAGSFTCELITCGHVQPPENGFLSNQPTYEVGTFMIFRCNQGYDTIGATKLLCRGDGYWSPEEAPICKIKSCGDFGEVQYGTHFQDSTFHERDTFGAVVEVTCYHGYVLEGHQEVICGESGWGPKPKCVPTTCDQYPGLNSSCIYKQKYSAGNLFVVCNQDTSVTKTGPSYVKCENNKWKPAPNDDLLACFCDCKVTTGSNMVISNLNSDGFLKHEETLNWRCKNDAVKDSLEPLTCLDGKLSSSPNCISKQPPVIVTDSSGHDKTIEIFSTTTNSTPESEPFPFWIPILVLSLLVSIIVAVCLYMRKRGYIWKSPDDKPDPVPTTHISSHNPPHHAMELSALISDQKSPPTDTGPVDDKANSVDNYTGEDELQNNSSHVKSSNERHVDMSHDDVLNDDVLLVKPADESKVNLETV
ncbi:Sushi [Mactra antiquata]